MIFKVVTTLTLSAGNTLALLQQPRSTANSTNARTSLTFLYQNNLNASDDINHVAAILLDPMTRSAGAASCADIGEALIPQEILLHHQHDFSHQLQYLGYAGYSGRNQRYLINNGTVSVNPETDQVSICAGPEDSEMLPVLCTQSSTQNQPVNAIATASNRVRISSNGNHYIGFRNLKSFRFNGIPYAESTDRFEYSSVYNQTGQTIDATIYGSDCSQAYEPASQENCLFMNIQTPYIPKKGSNTNLRPVLVSIYGGGFTGGNSAAGSGLDSGNLASREDLVGVQFNYRLSTLGFLAVPGTSIRGNFGIGDQITALRWIRKNIASFGGDPDRVTIIGESAGAGSVRALVGSPVVIAENLLTGAIAQSNLGGGKTLGLDGNYGTTFSSYYTVEESYAIAGQQIFAAVNCTQSLIDEQIACLKNVSAQTVQSLGTVARYIVQDGHYITREQLDVTSTNGSVAKVNAIFGTTADDGASFSTYPDFAVSTEVEGIQAALGISKDYAQAIVDSGLFPLFDSGNATLDYFNVSQRVATDTTFRCIDEATAFAGSQSGAFNSVYYYTMQRTYEGYDPNGLGASGLSQGPVEPGFAYGDPELPYFKLHGSDLGFTYGNQNPLRNEEDLNASQLISAYFSNFAKAGNPNSPSEYLTIRGYTSTLQGVVESGDWQPVSNDRGPTKALDYPSATVDFPDLAQCAWLNYSISYYLDGGM